MMKFLIRLLFTCLFAFSPLAFAQGTETSPKDQQQTQQEQKPSEDFFDTMDAPISYKGAFVKMMLTLLGLIVLIVISVWMLRRISHGKMKQMNYGRTIKILERRPLSAKSILYLVEIEGKKVVVAESQLDVRAITTADHLPSDEG